MTSENGKGKHYFLILIAIITYIQLPVTLSMIDCMMKRTGEVTKHLLENFYCRKWLCVRGQTLLGVGVQVSEVSHQVTR